VAKRCRARLPDGEDSALIVVSTASAAEHALALGTMQALAPRMRDRGYGRTVNVYSGLGQLNEMLGGYPAYRVSKAGLNALTRIFASELHDAGVLVNSVCHGWARTDIGGSQAQLEPEEAVATIVWAATLLDDGPTGIFFRFKQPISW
jgi:NAD(P)-dependent dehydrogenase (short-subunit alcohol dehydrogenase family)